MKSTPVYNLGKSLAVAPFVAVALGCAGAGEAVAQAPGAANIEPMRPPAVPLITHDPYFSIWSANDQLTDAPTRHWTMREQTLCSLIRVDGESFRLMGDQPAALPALPQTQVEVLSTRSIYTFANAKVSVVLIFIMLQTN